jgi:hypothetical protein
MIEMKWNLEELDPGDALDRRVRRRMRAASRKFAPSRRAAPLLPLERVVYAVVIAAYALYSGARAVRVFRENLSSTVVASAKPAAPPVTPRSRS